MQLSWKDLILASALPVLEVVMLCLVGAALVWKGLMKPEGRAFITKLMYFIFFPALVVTSLGTSVTLDTLKSWWPVPASTLLNVVLGMILGVITFPFVGMEPHLKPHFVSCAMAGNLGNLLMVLIPSIAAKASVFTDEDGEDGLAYVFTGLFAICIAVFTIVNYLLEQPQQQPAPDQPAEEHSTQFSPAPTSRLQARSDRDLHLSNTLDKPAPEGYAAVGAAAQEEEAAVNPLHSHRISDPQSSGSEDKLQMITAATEGLQESIVVHIQNPPVCDVMPTAEESRGHPEIPTAEYRVYGTSSSLSIPTKPSSTAHPVAEGCTKATFSSPDVRWRRGTSPCIYYDTEFETTAPTTHEGRGNKCLSCSWSCTEGDQVPTCAWTCGQYQEENSRRDIVSCRYNCGAVAEGLSQPNSPSAVSIPVMGSSTGKQNSKPPARMSAETASKRAHHHPQKKKEPSKWLVVSGKILKGLWNVPTIAISIGMIVACTPPLRRVFFGPDDDGNDDNDDKKGELEVITSALKRLGGAAIPCMMIAIGGALSNGPGGSKVPWKAVVALILIRLVILPALGGWAVIAADNAGWWPDNGKMFTLVLALQQAMPTALNVHTMASVNKNNEEVVASLLFWQYLACIVTIPVCVLVYLSKITG